MRKSVPTARYSPVCNVLRQWKTSLILTYRVYRLYDSYSYKTEKGLGTRQPRLSQLRYYNYTPIYMLYCAYALVGGAISIRDPCIRISVYINDRCIAMNPLVSLFCDSNV